MKRVLLLMIAAVCAATGCKKHNGGEIPPDKQYLPVNVSFSVETKAAGNSFEDGDRVGLYMVYGGTLQSNGNYSDNQKYSFNSGVWSTDKQIYWKDETTKADFYCYHPYMDECNPTAFAFKIAADQSSGGDYKASDLLWGKSMSVSPTKETISVSMYHLMSCVEITLKPGTGFTEEELSAAEKSVYISNIKNETSVNMSTGTVTVQGEPSTVKCLKDGEKYKAIIAPQTVAADAEMLVIEIGGVKYASKNEFTFKPGTCHSFTITVDKVNGNFSFTIEDWITDTDEHTFTVNNN